MTILIFIVILAVLVIVHEFGHFIAAKRAGVKVEEFGFGFPPRLFGFKKGETLYSVNLIPLGGFVKVYGEEYHEKTPNKNRAFVYKKPWQKAAIIVAGILGNFLLGWLLISYLFTQGVPVPTDKVLVERTQAGSPAATAGLKEGDNIVQIVENGKKHSVKTSSDLISLSKKYAGQRISIILVRDGTEKTVSLTPRANPPAREGSLGILITSFDERRYPWYQAPYFAFIESVSITKKIGYEILRTLGQLITFQKPSADVAGPIGIARFTGQVVKLGHNAVIELTALLSFNLAVINILPFPALDGGRLTFVLYEWITRRRVNKTVERYTNMIGIIILLSLAVLVSINDIIKIYR